MSKPDDQEERSEDERFERVAKAILKVKKSDIMPHVTITRTMKREVPANKVWESKEPRKKRS